MQEICRKNTPLVSIIVPVYNVEPYIRQCVDSLLEQDYPNYEIILIDDGSPDNCGQICDEYAQKCDMIHVIHQENAGVSAARNSGLYAAKGDYIAFVDSDDWVDPEFLSVLAKHMRPGGMSVCGRVLENVLRNEAAIWKPKFTTSQVSSMGQIEAEKSVLQWDGFGGFVCFKLFDREIIDNYDLTFRQDITILEDELFTMQYLSHINKDVILDCKAVYHYRMNPQSASSTYVRKYSEFKPEIFSLCVAHAEMEKHIVQSPELIRLVCARQIASKRTALFIMVINNWENLVYWETYLSDVRSGLFTYLRCDTGETAREKLKTILCAISPKLAWNCITTWKNVKYLGNTGCHRYST